MIKLIRNVGVPTLLLLLITPYARATSFIAPDDREMVRRADAIVVASALTSYTQQTADGGLETVTPISIEEAIKGVAPDAQIAIHEPGGFDRGRAVLIPGVPRFAPGQRLILFLTRTPQGTWAATELALGKFRFATDSVGHHLAVRDEEEIVGWEPDGTPHHEPRRSAEAFLAFLRREAHGAVSKQDYFVGNSPIVAQSELSAALTDSTAPPTSASTYQAAVTYAPRTYTSDLGNGNGARWNVFPSGVTFYSGATQEPGAPGGGVTAVQTALASWDNDSGSNVNYVYGGTDSTHTNGLSAPDGANTVLFERNLSAYGVAPFTCSGSSYSGTLGIGGVTNASGTNTLGGVVFYTALEGDVEMNQGIANCSLLFGNGDWNSAVAHEVGHTLGFRHSDQNRAGNAACSTDASLECSSNAIMRSFIPSGLNAALQSWDINAVRAVYPGASCTLPTVSISASSTSITAGQSVTLSSSTTGSPTSYQWYVGTSGNTGSPISGGTGSSITVTPSSTTSYWLRVTNSCGSANSNTVTITVSAPPPPPVRRQLGDYTGDGRADFAIFRPSTGQWIISGVGTIQWGQSGDQPVPADYDGDGITDVAVFRVSNGWWYWKNTTKGGSGGVAWGSPGQIAVPGDYDGDGRADFALYQTNNNWWYIKYATGATVGVQWGVSGDQPVPFDYDGDGKADIGVYRPSTGQWLIKLSSVGGAAWTVQWGQPGDTIPVAADYDGDGKQIDIGIFRPSAGIWYRRINNGGAVPQGASGDTPVPADYSGDGLADPAVFRSSTGWWYQYGVTGFQQGQPGDVAPIPR